MRHWLRKNPRDHQTPLSRSKSNLNVLSIVGCCKFHIAFQVLLHGQGKRYIYGTILTLASQYKLVSRWRMVRVKHYTQGLFHFFVVQDFV